ncbi:AAA family ATPase [Leptolyngbya valderiana BDU 20041]|nr:AAA family ATPase [Leptolyngbya valderiana BDU 20041]
MPLTPWYKLDGIQPRRDLREGKGLDMADFAVHLDQVRDGRAPADYTNPEQFFDRTYLTQSLTNFAAQVLRRLSGRTDETNAVYNLATQFGGGKTHALTLLYHLARHGAAANSWTGVSQLLKHAEIDSVPQAAVATFVGVEFDSLSGRGGDDNTPKRRTPWGEIAWQLGGRETFAAVAEHDEKFMAPKGDVIRRMFPENRPCLILMDEILNYVSGYRKQKWGNQLYNFIQALSETVRGQKNVVLVVSIPASEIEYTDADEADEQRFKKVLDRVGEAVSMSAESETTEIIRRRLFEWDDLAVNAKGRLLLPKDAVKTCKAYADWVKHHHQLLGDFPVNRAQERFEETYPFHPSIFDVFERKWQAIPRFQRTRGVLRMLALWVSHTYQKGYQDAYREPLITLGTAPLEEQKFRSVVFEQLGENRLEGAVTTDISGTNAHAVRLDLEAENTIKKARLHCKVATAIFFESNGGCTRTEATLPELRLDVGDPNLDIANVENVLETLSSDCYYLLLDKNRYRFSLKPNLNKIIADRRSVVESSRIEECVRAEVQKIFAKRDRLDIVYFPKKSNDISNSPSLSLAVIDPNYTFHPTDKENTLKLLDRYLREHGASNRTYKSAVIFSVADDTSRLYSEVRKLLALEDIRDRDSDRLDDSQKKQLELDLKKSSRAVKEFAWGTYRHLAILGKDNTLRTIDLGQVNSSQGDSLTDVVLRTLKEGGELEQSISANYLLRNWAPAFEEWSTRAVRDAFFSSPQFPRILNPDSLKNTIATGVERGLLAYVGKASGDRYEPFYFRETLSPEEIEISDNMFVVRGETAEAYKQRLTEPQRLVRIELSPETVVLKPNEQQAFIAKGYDQYGDPFPLTEITWNATGGDIDTEGVLTAGQNAGNFTVTAISGNIEETGRFSVQVPKSTKDNRGTYTPGDRGDTPTVVEPEPQGLRWRGQVPPQRWMQLYMQVFSKLVSDPNRDVSIAVEFSISGEVSESQVTEMQAALQSLGLEGAIETPLMSDEDDLESPK